jgi:hypothetical protein
MDLLEVLKELDVELEDYCYQEDSTNVTIEQVPIHVYDVIVPLIWLQDHEIGDIIDGYCEEQDTGIPLPCSCLHSALLPLVETSTKLENHFFLS